MNTPIRILHVVSDMGVGGIQSFLMNIYRAIDIQKVQFDFLIHTPMDNGFENEIKSHGGKIFHQQRFKIFNYISYKAQFKNFLVEHPEYSIIHIHIRSTSTLCAKVAKSLNRYVIVHSHATTNGYSLKAKLVDLFQKHAGKVADYCMGCSKQANDWMFGHDIAQSSKCAIVRNGIDSSRYIYNEKKRDSIRGFFSIASDEILIGTVGRLVDQKNQQLLIHAMRMVRNPHIKLMIVGDGPLKPILEKLAGGDSRIIFTGSRKDVPDLLQGMDAFFLPSKNEGLGIAAIEAQAAGLPTYISDQVPDEVMITTLCRRIKSYDIHGWVDVISHCKFEERVNTEDIIQYAGFDVSSVATSLQNFYLNTARGE